MKIFILIALFCTLNSCGSRKPSFIESGDKIVKITGIDSTESAYLINIRNKEIGDYILVSWKQGKEDGCKNTIEVGKKYKINLEIELFAHYGHVDGYVIEIDDIMFDIETGTGLAYTDDLRGLCLDNN